MDKYMDNLMIGLATVVVFVMAGFAIKVLLEAPLEFLTGVGIIVAVFAVLPAIGWLVDKFMIWFTTRP